MIEPQLLRDIDVSVRTPLQAGGINADDIFLKIILL